jgi:hypothetical protein
MVSSLSSCQLQGRLEQLCPTFPAGWQQCAPIQVVGLEVFANQHTAHLHWVFWCLQGGLRIEVLLDVQRGRSCQTRRPLTSLCTLALERRSSSAGEHNRLCQQAAASHARVGGHSQRQPCARKLQQPPSSRSSVQHGAQNGCVTHAQGASCRFDTVRPAFLRLGCSSRGWQPLSVEPLPGLHPVQWFSRSAAGTKGRQQAVTVARNRRHGLSGRPGVAQQALSAGSSIQPPWRPGSAAVESCCACLM